MKFLREKVAAGEFLTGAWCNLGSSIAAEMAGQAGFDWILIDLEHGNGDMGDLRGQLQATAGTPAAPIVRIVWNDPLRFKRALDLRASGEMVPWVNTAEEALQAARAMRYPPDGIRGISSLTRANKFGLEFEEYVENSNESLLTVVQIETPIAVENASQIASVEGVDVLFIGPLDLSTNLRIRGQYTHPVFREALTKVVAACAQAGKRAGILLQNAAQIERAVEDGLKFVALGSDGGLVARGMRENAALLNKFKA
jgi:4-hydroxy-2-oxoheptanedioate aldolase